MMADEFEIWFDKGVTDGLPVVPPTRERVEHMLAGTGRARDELLGKMPPNYGRLTVEKAAINAVLAGCRPDYLPVVIAAAECACDPAFNLHGVATSTHFAAPLIVVNGPIRTRIGLNSAFGVFGPGYRANATIGRALRLLMINVGGARPGEISMSTLGHPGRYTYCIAENEDASPWPPYHAGRGFPVVASTVTLFAGEAPHGISDHSSRTARALGGSLGWSMAGLWNSKHFPLYSHTMLVVGPEHARTFADDGWSKEDLKRHLFETVRRPYRSLLPDEDHGEGTNLRFGTTESRPGPEGPRRRHKLEVRDEGVAGARDHDLQVSVDRGNPRGRGRRHRGALLGGDPRLARYKERLAPGHPRRAIIRLTCRTVRVILQLGSGTHGVR